MKKKILVAEDEKEIAEVLQLKLENYGYKIRIVRDGQETLDELQREKYDLLLLDLMMPKLSGFEVLQAIRDNKIDIKVIVNTNLCQDEDRKKALDLGAKDYLVKSDVLATGIVEKVQQVLD